MRAPDAPMGCPSAHAPPLTLTRSAGKRKACIAAKVTTANASLISNRSTFSKPHPQARSSFCNASMGASVKRCGSRACAVVALMLASGFQPCRSANDLRAKTSMAAPSEMDEAFAAVMLPSLTKAPFRRGILARSALKGCSSFCTTEACLREGSVMGTISPSKLPSSLARRASFKERMAKSSISLREICSSCAVSSANTPMLFFASPS